MITSIRYRNRGRPRTIVVAAALLASVLAVPVAHGKSVEAAATTTAETTQLRDAGLPFGPSKLPTEMFGQLFTGTKLKLYPKTVSSTLNAARANGMRVFIVLVGSQSNYRNPDGTFNLELWKASLAVFRDVDFTEFVADGTIIGHQLIEEAKARKQWGGTVITNDVLDEMAGYSKKLWPTLPTVLRVEPSKLAKHAGGWQVPWSTFDWGDLDAAWAQYSARKGPVAEYAGEQSGEADRQNLGLVLGLNVLNGGDGSSGIASPHGGGEWVMSPNELRIYGRTLMDQVEGCAFMMWRYETPGSDLEDFVYFRRADVHAAMQDLAQIAAERPAAPCRSTSRGRFVDDDGHLFEPAIEWLAEAGITKGCNPPANTRFCPQGFVTRGQMAAFLVRALGLRDSLDGPFIDDDHSIFEADIERLAAAGITKGCNPPVNNRYCPDRRITRGQMAAFLVRALGYVDNGSVDRFVDDDNDIFESDIERLAAAGVTKGCNPPANDKYCPDDAVTRGQMAAFLSRALS